MAKQKTVEQLVQDKARNMLASALVTRDAEYQAAALEVALFKKHLSRQVAKADKRNELEHALAMELEELDFNATLDADTRLVTGRKGAQDIRAAELEKQAKAEAKAEAKAKAKAEQATTPAAPVKAKAKGNGKSKQVIGVITPS